MPFELSFRFLLFARFRMKIEGIYCTHKFEIDGWKLEKSDRPNDSHLSPKTEL